MTSKPEPYETRLKRQAMRSMRRGIKEMDVILSSFATAHLADLSAPDLDAYENLLDENDHDLYAWVCGTTPSPEAHDAIIEAIRVHISGNRLS